MSGLAFWLGPVLGVFVIIYSCRSENIARGKPTVQGSDWGQLYSDRAVDGDYTTIYSSCSHTDNIAWWTVDLLSVYTLNRVVIYNRDEVQERLDNLVVEGCLGDPFLTTSGVLCAFHPGPSGDVVTLNCIPEIRARYIRLRLTQGSYLTMCEVEMFGQKAADQGPSMIPKHAHRKVWRVAGQKLTSSVDLGNAVNVPDCLRRCQWRPNCSIFNFNNVTNACTTSTGLLNSKSLTSADNWNLYGLSCAGN